MKARASLSDQMRVLLVLGRISNLPTVWSNCLAAWLLAGGGSWKRFACLATGASLLYTGGMFLNDAFDVEFDRQYRPERPTPRGLISRRAVWILSAVFLLVGWWVLVPLGAKALGLGAVLLAGIALYDAVHKRTSLAPWLMSACRFLLYLVAAAAAHLSVNSIVVWRALALAAYVIGLSHLARGESLRSRPERWPAALLCAPIVLTLLTGALGGWLARLAAASLGGWILWCLRGLFLPRPERGPSSGVAGLLAGIALVDWVAAVNEGQSLSAVFVGLFLLALALQRLAPAT